MDINFTPMVSNTSNTRLMQTEKKYTNYNFNIFETYLPDNRLSYMYTSSSQLTPYIAPHQITSDEEYDFFKKIGIPITKKYYYNIKQITNKYQIDENIFGFEVEIELYDLDYNNPILLNNYYTNKYVEIPEYTNTLTLNTTTHIKFQFDYLHSTSEMTLSEFVAIDEQTLIKVAYYLNANFIDDFFTYTSCVNNVDDVNKFIIWVNPDTFNYEFYQLNYTYVRWNNSIPMVTENYDNENNLINKIQYNGKKYHFIMDNIGLVRVAYYSYVLFSDSLTHGVDMTLDEHIFYNYNKILPMINKNNYSPYIQPKLDTSHTVQVTEDANGISGHFNIYHNGIPDGIDIIYNNQTERNDARLWKDLHTIEEQKDNTYMNHHFSKPTIKTTTRYARIVNSNTLHIMFASTINEYRLYPIYINGYYSSGSKILFYLNKPNIIILEHTYDPTTINTQFDNFSNLEDKILIYNLLIKKDTIILEIQNNGNLLIEYVSDNKSPALTKYCEPITNMNTEYSIYKPITMQVYQEIPQYFVDAIISKYSNIPNINTIDDIPDNYISRDHSMSLIE